MAENGHNGARTPMPALVGVKAHDKPTTLVQGRSAAVHIPPPVVGDEKASLERLASWMLSQEVCRHPSGDAGLSQYWMALQALDGFPSFRVKFVNRMAQYARVDPHVSGSVDLDGFARHCWHRMLVRLSAWCDRVAPGVYMDPALIVEVFERYFVKDAKATPMEEQRFTFETPRSDTYRADGHRGWLSSGEKRSGTMHDLIQDLDISETEKTFKHNQFKQRSENVEKVLDARR